MACEKERRGRKEGGEGMRVWRLEAERVWGLEAGGRRLEAESVDGCVLCVVGFFWGRIHCVGDFCTRRQP